MRFLTASLVVALFVAGAPVEGARKDRAQVSRPMSNVEAEVLREHNLARTHPREYAAYVREWLAYYDGKSRRLPNRPAIRTVEGTKGVADAIRFLEAQQPLPALRASHGLARAARDHVADTGARGWMGHIGSDDTEPADRVSRYGRWYGRVGENITYGGWDARELVIRLIIDDGITDRGHRRNVFNPEFSLAGVAFGDHEEYGTMCVITYAAEFDEN